MAGAGRETAYRYGRNGELLEVSDNRQRLSVAYKYDVMGRETERIFGNGVSQHTAYDKAGRVILITEKSGNNLLLRGEGYVYDSLGRRSATVSHTGAVTRYEYNPAGQLAKVLYPESQELRDLQEQEARQHGLFWQEGVSGLSNGHLSTGEYTELSRLFVRMRNGGGFLPATQVFRVESYTYDANGNRATKTTAYGTITYSYDAENRLVKTCGDTGVGVEYAYDNNGNLLSQTSSLKHSIYEYNPQNRMVRSRVVDDEARTIASTRYGYDVLGRRTLVQDNGTTTLRTLYDGLSFDVVKESPVYSSGGFTDTYNTGIQYSSAGRATGERYRYLDDGATATSGKYQYIEDSAYQTVFSRYSSERTMLYAYGSPVAINRASGTRGYLGTDILGSTRSVTDNHGVQESYYDYDIFGSPITGNYATGTDYGYLGKPYDSITGLYNYGYRDYSPQTVRFTTVDPIRDGANWFAYVNNDPVNYIDLWGLLASDGKKWYEKVKDFFTGVYHKVTEFHFERRDALNTSLPTYKELTDQGDGWIQVAPEFSIFHDNGFGYPELKYIHPDGREVVYTRDFSSDGSYEIYTDPKYKGTYNYVVVPGNKPDDILDVKGWIEFGVKGIGHVFADVIPYYLTGKKNEREE